LLASPALAISFNLGALEGQLDSELSLETLWSTSRRDARWIGVANGGHGQSQSGDDGRLNFKRGDAISKRFEGVHGLELRLHDTGVFLRGRYWYDAELQDESRPHKDIANGHRTPSAQAAGSQWLEAFFYHHYQWAGQSGTLRLGRQTVRWGESQFIDGGLDAINPRDLSHFIGPGEAVQGNRLPTNLLYLSQSLKSGLMLDGFYQLNWTADALSNCGTFFSTSDALAEGCAGYDVGSGLEAAQWQKLSSQATAHGLGYQAGAEGVRLARGGDESARHSGQFGLALHWQGPRLRVGLHWLNYHSRAPMFNTRTADAATFQALPSLLVDTGAALSSLPSTEVASLLAAQSSGVRMSRGRYFLSYPEDIRLYGLSASSQLSAGTRWFGEFSYRPNAPIQLNQAALVQRLSEAEGAGKTHQGYQRKGIAQWQSGLTHELGALAGAEQASLSAELGYVRVMGLGSQPYGRDPVFGTQGSEGFVTAAAWGYRLSLAASYAGLLPRVRVQPRLAFSHDVDGYGPNDSFSEGAKAFSLGADLLYMDSYRLGLTYSGFYGGRYNPRADRDFLRLSLGLAF